MKEYVYITLGKFYLYNLIVDSRCAYNSFVENVEWSTNKINCTKYSEKMAEATRWKLDEVGFSYSITGTEKVEMEED